MKQLTIFDAPRLEPLPVRRSDPITSRLAAEVTAANRRVAQQRVLDTLRLCTDGATTLELSHRMGCDRASMSSRMHELEAQGAIYRTGERRRTSARATSEVWAVTEKR